MLKKRQDRPLPLSIGFQVADISGSTPDFDFSNIIAHIFDFFYAFYEYYIGGERPIS